MRSALSLAAAALGIGVATVLTAMPPAHAEDAPAPVAPVSTSENITVLPLFGTQLAVSLVSDGAGALTAVNLSNVDGYTATMVKPNRVAFESNDGTNTVVVKNRPDGGQRVEARAGSLDAIGGEGRWSGDVFGDGTTTTVDYLVGQLDGGPDITVTNVSDATAVVGEVHHEVEGDEAEAGVRIRFSNGTLTRELRIRATLGTDEDGTPEAKLTVTLGRLRELSNGEGGKPAQTGKPQEPGKPEDSGKPQEPGKPEEPGKHDKDGRPRTSAPAVNTPVASSTTEPSRERQRRGGDATTTTATPSTSAAPSTTEAEAETD